MYKYGVPPGADDLQIPSPILFAQGTGIEGAPTFIFRKNLIFDISMGVVLCWILLHFFCDFVFLNFKYIWGHVP